MILSNTESESAVNTHLAVLIYRSLSLAIFAYISCLSTILVTHQKLKNNEASAPHARSFASPFADCERLPRIPAYGSLTSDGFSVGGGKTPEVAIELQSSAIKDSKLIV